jgi:RNA polymerase sigma-70 factor (ECF subfamily)
MSAFDQLNRQLNDEMQALAEKIKSGEYTEKDRNRLASIMYPKLKYFIWKFFNETEPTEEVLHNTLFKIFKGIEKYSDSFRFTTWIYTIAKNESLLHQHKMRTQFAVCIDDVEHKIDRADDSNFVLDRELYMESLYSETLRIMTTMPDCIEKSILIDKEINHMRGNDLAEKYEMNLNTVKTKIRKARKMLREQVLEVNPEFKDRLKEFL